MVLESRILFEQEGEPVQPVVLSAGMWFKIFISVRQHSLLLVLLSVSQFKLRVTLEIISSKSNFFEKKLATIVCFIKMTSL
jgi:hypothetical protein